MEEEGTDEVVEAVAKLKAKWEENLNEILKQLREIEGYGYSGIGENNLLPRLNAASQDGLALMRNMQFKLELLAEQLPTEEQIHSAKAMLKSWKDQYKSLQLSLRNANLEAKSNLMKAAQKERELLLGGGEESTIRRRNLQTKTGLTTATEGITESLRRTRQLMVQEVERNTSTLMTFESSTSVLKKTESEYKGQRTLLMRTRNLLSTMRRQDVLERIILIIGMLFFFSVVTYIFIKRIGLLKLQKRISSALKQGSVLQGTLDAGNALMRADRGAPLQQNVGVEEVAEGVPLNLPIHEDL